MHYSFLRQLFFLFLLVKDKNNEKIFKILITFYIALTNVTISQQVKHCGEFVPARTSTKELKQFTNAVMPQVKEKNAYIYIYLYIIILIGGGPFFSF